MPDHLSPAEFQTLMDHWDPATKALILERMASNFATGSFQHFTQGEATTLRAIAARLIPDAGDIDLIGFLDSTLTDPLGRGDRHPDLPDTPELMHRGLAGMDESAQLLYQKDFSALKASQQDALLTALRANTAPGSVWQEIPADRFVLALYRRLLHGYYAHPLSWMRIGFYGASFPEGYAWLSGPEVKQRHARGTGWDRL